MLKKRRPADSHTMEPDRDYLNSLGYETRDVAPKTLVNWGIGLAVFIGINMAIALGTYLFFMNLWPDTEREIGSAITQVKHLPPSPRLQVHPIRDIRVFRQEERQRLTSYGPVNDGQGRVHIPIERALELTAERGLPTRAGSPAGPGSALGAGRGAPSPTKQGYDIESGQPGGMAPVRK